MKELIEIQQALKAPKGKENSFQGFNYRSAESASSYAKKYALGNMFLIDNTKDADTKDNSEENKPSSKKELEDTKEGLKAAFKDGELNKAYFGLSKIQQTELRDFANELKSSSKSSSKR